MSDQQTASTRRFNESISIGSRVTVTKDNGAEVETRTRSAAWLLSGHTEVVQLEGIAGCYLTSRVRAGWRQSHQEVGDYNHEGFDPSDFGLDHL